MELPPQCYEYMQPPAQAAEKAPLRHEVAPVDAISLLLLEDDDDGLMAPELLDPGALPSASGEPQMMGVQATGNVVTEHESGSMGKNASISEMHAELLEMLQTSSDLGGQQRDENYLVGKKRQNPDTAGRKLSTSRRNRKSTWLARKEEKEQLLDEVATLEVLATVLKTREEGKQRTLCERDICNAMLRQASRSQQLYVASAQSGISGLLASDPTNPLSTFIRLGTDWDERRRALTTMKELKIRHACEYVSARSLALDPLKPYFSDELFENDNGDYNCVRFQMIQFKNAKSVRQVYDALLSYLHNMEIRISECLGHITVRDEYDSIEQSIANYRLLTTESGVLVESNSALFLKYFDAHELSQGAPCGVITTDFVNEDQLHPYSPQQRIRKDITATAVLTPHVSVKPNGDEEFVVTMSRASFVTLHHAEFAVASDAIQDIREEMARWGDVMISSINESIRSKM
ncbi:hypothetical protein FI667_g7623, partial [Globisporangium splendens]